MQKSYVWKWNGTGGKKWTKLDNLRLELPRDTLLKAEFVQEMKGEVIHKYKIYKKWQTFPGKRCQCCIAISLLSRKARIFNGRIPSCLVDNRSDALKGVEPFTISVGIPY